MNRLAPSLVAALSAALLVTSPVAAQKGSARLFGTVVNRATQGPIPNARIVHTGDGRSVVSDSLGFYQFAELPAGIVRFLVRAPQLPVASFAVALTNGERMERDIELDTSRLVASETAQELPNVAVEAPASMALRYRDFERRRTTGRGHYLTRTQIEESGAASLQEAVRHLRGVTIRCGGQFSLTACSIFMARAPARCAPEYIVDERVDNWFGPSVAVRDIEAVEIYTGPSDVPGEFGGSTAGCGVIVIWTKSGPPKKR